MPVQQTVNRVYTLMPVFNYMCQLLYEYMGLTIRSAAFTVLNFIETRWDMHCSGVTAMGLEHIGSLTSEVFILILTQTSTCGLLTGNCKSNFLHRCDS
jgi:hypothetical protein